MKTNTYPNPWDLHYFQEIASTNNLSRASERLGVSQPTLSLSLKRLEELLNTELFYRRNKGLELTRAGHKLLRESNKLLEAWQSVLMEAQKSETEMSGIFSIGCHPSVAIYTLKTFMRDIYNSHKGIEINLVHGLSRTITEGVISGRIDFGLVVNPSSHPDLVIHKMAKDTVTFWQSSNALTDVLIYNPELAQSQALLQKIKKQNIFHRTIHSDSLEVIANLASAGAGVAILPSKVAMANAHNLKKMPLMPSYTDEIAFIYRSDLSKTACSKYLIQVLKKITFDD